MISQKIYLISLDRQKDSGSWELKLKGLPKTFTQKLEWYATSGC